MKLASLTKTKHIHFLLLLLIMSGLIGFSISDFDLRKRLQYLTFDTFNKLHERPALDLVTVVDLDEATLSQVGQWPWPRPLVGKMVERLNELGAKVIAFDMVFGEPDRTSPSQILNFMEGEQITEEFKATVSDLPDHDELFAQQIKKAGNVVLGFTGAGLQDTARIPSTRAVMLPMKQAKQFQLESFNPAGLITNLPVLSKSAAGNGSFIASPDIDGIMRRAPLFITFPHSLRLDNETVQDFYLAKAPHLMNKPTKMHPMLALEAVRAYMKGSFYHVKRLPAEQDSFFNLPYTAKIKGDLSVPIDEDSKFWIHYRTLQDHEYVSAFKVLDPAFDDEIREQIEGKIIMVGTSAEGLRDIRSTPLSIFIPGVEVHVNVIEQILQKRYLIQNDFMGDIEALYILLAAIFVIIFTNRFGVLIMSMFVSVIVGGAFAGSFMAYKDLGLLFDPTYPSFSIILMFFMTIVLNYIRIEADRKKVKEAFGLYISPSFMEELAKDPDKLKLGGEIKELTVLFSDIRNFTSISESLTPEELIQLMNDFLTPMSDLVMEHRGTIDKYMGDAMMAFWNAPLEDENHHRNACKAAILMQEALEPINERLREKAKEQGTEDSLVELKAGIGINSGPCSVGNMGSRKRFAYSALGDAVNLASRLEGQTKAYGVEILIGENTYKEVSDFACLELDLIKVKGKTQPERIYALLGDAEMAKDDTFTKLAAQHEEFLKLYRDQGFKNANTAIKAINKLLDENKNIEIKNYYEMMKTRITDLEAHKLPDDWDGVFVATSK